MNINVTELSLEPSSGPRRFLLTIYCYLPQTKLFAADSVACLQPKLTTQLKSNYM